MISNENIKAFVRQTLGCACPEEVFNLIDCQANIKLNEIKEVADIIFKTIDKDERIYLHIIPKNNTPLFSDECLQ